MMVVGMLLIPRRCNEKIIIVVSDGGVLSVYLVAEDDRIWREDFNHSLPRSPSVLFVALIRATAIVMDQEGHNHL